MATIRNAPATESMTSNGNGQDGAQIGVPLQYPAIQWLAQQAGNLSYAAFTDLEKRQYRNVLLDYIGAVLAGRKCHSAQVIVDAGAAAGYGTCNLHTRSVTGSAFLAAGFNSAMAHAVEVDSGHIDVTGWHPTVTIVPAVIAIADLYHLSGLDIMNGVVAGYEVGGRIGGAMAKAHRALGFHATGTVGVLAAAAAGARSLKLSPEQTADALGLASAMAGGTFAFLDNAIEAKHLHGAHAAMAGIWAVTLAAKGMRGPWSALEADEGFYAAYARKHVDWSRLTRDFLVAKEIERAHIKPYACCGHIAGSIDLAAQVATTVGSQSMSIRRITVRTYAAAAVLSMKYPDNTGQAQFSIPFCVAKTIIDGNGSTISPDAFDVTEVAREDIRALAGKIDVIENTESTDLFPRVRRTDFMLEWPDGKISNLRTDFPKGMPENPVSGSGIEAKFRCLAEPAIGRKYEDAELLVEDIESRGGDWSRKLADLLAYASIDNRVDKPGDTNMGISNVD